MNVGCSGAFEKTWNRRIFGNMRHDRQKNEFILTFENTEATKIFKDFGDFETENGVPCRVNVQRPERRNYNGKISVPIKVHWVPYHIDMQAAPSELEKTPGVRITGARYDTIKNDPEMGHIRTGIRTVWVEVQNVEAIPHKIHWKSKGEKGTALLTVFGRAVPCFRCWDSGHSRQECAAIKCGKCHKFGHSTNLCSGISYAQMASDKERLETEADLHEAEIIDDDMEETEQAQGMLNETVKQNIQKNLLEIRKQTGQTSAHEGTDKPTEQNKSCDDIPSGGAIQTSSNGAARGNSVKETSKKSNSENDTHNGKEANVSIKKGNSHGENPENNNKNKISQKRIESTSDSITESCFDSASGDDSCGEVDSMLNTVMDETNLEANLTSTPSQANRRGTIKRKLRADSSTSSEKSETRKESRIPQSKRILRLRSQTTSISPEEMGGGEDIE
jgi:hypothetical protein